MRSQAWTWNEGDRVVLRAFERSNGLTMLSTMRALVGSVVTVTALALPGSEPNGSVEVTGGWWWPGAALEPEGARSIWPTGKPAGYWPRLNERVWLLPFNREYDRYANRWADVCVVYPVPPGCVAVFIDGCTTAQWWPVESMVPARTRGIAEGRRLAAARMRRFVAWLNGLRLPFSHWTEGRLWERYMSPEQAVVAAVDDGMSWPFVAVGGLWGSAWWTAKNEPGLARAMLGLGEFANAGPSPEWAALPWQREAGR